MAEITNEKRVLISPDRATLADYVANRFLRRIEKHHPEFAHAPGLLFAPRGWGRSPRRCLRSP